MNAINYNKKNAWQENKNNISQIFDYAENYKDFLNRARTERLTVEIIKEKIKDNSEIKIINNGAKNIAIYKRGKSPLEGIKFIGSHIDVPRIDIKQNPVYEKHSIAQLKTHYYGGIKKYHWFNRPLGIFGVIFTKNGKKIDLSIGINENEPVFIISDLLPHLSQNQVNKKLSEAFEAERMNIIAGSIPFDSQDDKIKDKIKYNVLHILNKKYGIIEEDFISAELQLVPIEKVRDVGIDGSFVGGYGHDDRVCAYTSFTALLEAENTYPICAVMYDKEEVGSSGKTGANSRFLEDAVIEILKDNSIEPSYINIRQTMKNSEMISADVNAGINPDYAEVHEIQNAGKMGYGIVLTKFTGHRGKAAANDADGEFVYKIRSIYNRNNVIWQSAELGKVDQGGGGTIAKFIAEYGMNVIDSGPPLLGMHSPFEIVSKADLFETHKAYKAFFNEHN